MTRRERWRPVDRQRAVRSAVLIALAALLAACGSPATSPSGPSPRTGTASAAPTRICEEFQTADAPPFSCTEVIGKVLLAMGPDAAAVKAAWFRLGRPCPPNARCIAPPPNSAYVVVRLESGAAGIFPVRFAGEEVAVEAVTEPTFDIWPPSGEAIPPVGRPDVGPGVPAEIAGRPALPLCWDEGAGVFDSPVARRCFLGAVLDGRPAELVSRAADEVGDPIKYLYRFAGRGPFLVYRSPSPAGPAWVRNDCAIVPTFDETQIFVVAECLSTDLS